MRQRKRKDQVCLPRRLTVCYLHVKADSDFSPPIFMYSILTASTELCSKLHMIQARNNLCQWWCDMLHINPYLIFSIIIIIISCAVLFFYFAVSKSLDLFCFFLQVAHMKSIKAMYLCISHCVMLKLNLTNVMKINPQLVSTTLSKSKLFRKK